MRRRLVRLFALAAAAAAVVVSQSACSKAPDANLSPASASEGVPMGRVVRCGGEAAGLGPGPPRRGERVLLGRVALPPERFPGRPNYAPEYFQPLPYFAKYGLGVRAGREPVDLVIPVPWRNRFAIAWGNLRVQQAAAVRIFACEWAEWLRYPGGYYLREPACVPLIVRVGGRSARIRLGIGRACP